jgi:threonine aldolase
MNMQLASKMRFVSAQLIALLTDGLWLRSASHANAMAQRLSEGVSAIDGLSLTQTTQSNGVFAVLPPAAAAKVRESFRFYDWDQARGEVRWMCSWDTTETDVQSLLAAVEAAVASASGSDEQVHPTNGTRRTP